MTFIARRISAGSFSLFSALILICGFATPAAAQGASVEYVKICSQYGAGFYYIPGTDTCIRLGGWMRDTGNSGYVCRDRTGAFFSDNKKCRTEPPRISLRQCQTGGVKTYTNAAGCNLNFFGSGAPTPATSYVTPPSGGWLELGVTFGHTGNNQNATVDPSFGTAVSGSVMDSTNTVGFDARFRVPVAGNFNAFGGYRFSSYTNAKGELVINFHPTPGNDTFLSYRPDSSHTFYGGVGIPLFGTGVVQGIDAAAIDLYAGYRHVTGDITGSTNETGGGGIVNPLGGGFNQNGLLFGGEFNIRTNVAGFPIILGVGADVAKLGDGTISNRSSLGFIYDTVLPKRTETTVFGKVAVPLADQWSRSAGSDTSRVRF